MMMIWLATNAVGKKIIFAYLGLFADTEHFG